MKKKLLIVSGIMFLVLINLSCVLAFTEAHGVTLNITTGGQTGKGGEIIKIGSYNLTLWNATKNSLDNSVRAYVYDASLNHLVNASFVSNIAQLNITLNASEIYYILADGEGASVTHRRSEAAAGYPIAGTNLNWLSGRGDGSNTSDAYIFDSLEVETLITSTLASCSASNNITYINFTFKDENTLANINAEVDSSSWVYWISNQSDNQSLSYSNTTSQASYPFCHVPANETIQIDLIFKYSNDSYPQRTYVLSNQSLTNTTTNQVLYLLGSGDGIYSSFQFYSSGNNQPISDLKVTIEREINSVWTIIGSGTTDNAGAVTFWVNPNYNHRITASKTGYTTQTQTVQPSQSVYTIFMGSTELNVTEYRYRNIKFNLSPSAGRLDKNTIYNFNYNVTAGDSNIISCKFELKNLSLDVVASNTTGCSASGGNLTITYNTGSNNKLFGYYYVDVGSGLELLKANDAWFMENLDVNPGVGLINFLTELDNLPDWGDGHNRSEYSKIVFCFFFMILLIGLFTYFSGYDLSNPGSSLIIIWVFMIMYSIGGLMSLEGLTPYTHFNQYWIAYLTTFIFIGFVLNNIRKEGT